MIDMQGEIRKEIFDRCVSGWSRVDSDTWLGAQTLELRSQPHFHLTAWPEQSLLQSVPSLLIYKVGLKAVRTL